MNRADFVHLVRLSEHDSADNSAAYRRSVMRFAALGYAWVLGCLLLGGALLVWGVSAMLRGQFRFYLIWMLLGAAGLFWTSLRALWCRFDAPEGRELLPLEAPALFEALARIQKKIKGPPIHRVLLSSEFNASITQLPRWGLLGGSVNYLTIGLPLLLAIDRPRFLAVMAHEYGHLRGGHGTFAAWIYRTRLSWARLEHGLRDNEGPVAAATQAFLRWYFPRFAAKTFALARQDEYEADRIAGKLLGKQVAADALSEIAIKGDWLGREFWPLHWRAASHSAQPVGPFAAMRQLLGRPPGEVFAQQSFRRRLREISDVDDTHPGLRDRLEALDAPQRVPAWSGTPALALLGADADRWVTRFDEQWCRDNGTDWRLHHAYLARVRSRISELTASAGRHNADEAAALGDLHRRLDPALDVRPHYERALQITPGHAGALRGLVLCLPEAERAARLAHLTTLFEHSAAHRWWACRAAVAELEQPAPDGSQDTAALKRWRERLKDASEAEGRVWEELSDSAFFNAISRHHLSEFELGELLAGLALCKPIARAWLVRKNLREFAWRRAYLLFIELPGLHDDDRYALCRSLEQSLDLPGPVLVLWAGHSPTLAEIERHAFEVVYRRHGG